MTTYRDGINLTAKTNAELKSIVARLTANAAVAEQFRFDLSFAQNWGVRAAVFQAAVAIDAWKSVNTSTTRTAPSPTSLDWSNVEGGHVFHQVPVFAG